MIIANKDKSQLISFSPMSCLSLLGGEKIFMYEKNEQLVDLRNESALNENAFEKETIDLIITSPPYNVGKDYGSKEEDNLTYEEYLKFSES
jgi:DNA modification methylase